MPIDYRYHIGSFVAIFLALLLGILIGIGLAPSPTEFEQRVALLQDEYKETREAKKEELALAESALREADTLAKEATAGIIAGRLAGLRVAIVLDHSFGGDPLPDNLRALMREAGATLASTTTITRAFVSLPVELKDRVAQSLSLYPPPGVHFRSVIAEGLAEALARGQPDLVHELEAMGLIKSSADSDYRSRLDVVLLVGGPATTQDASPERIDLPMIEEFARSGVQVVGCEPRDAPISCVPLYKAKGIPTVDSADTVAGRLAIVLALAGAEGHFGVKDTADRFLPEIPPYSKQ